VIPGTVAEAGQAKAADVKQMQALVVDLDTGDTIRPRTWAECRDFAVFIGGPSPALRDDQPYGPADKAIVLPNLLEATPSVLPWLEISATRRRTKRSSHKNWGL